MKKKNITKKYRGVSNFTAGELVYYIRKGYTSAAIAKILKTTPAIINQALVDYEIDPPHISTKDVVDMYASGIPTAVISDNLKITPLAVFYKLVKGGVYVRKNGKIDIVTKNLK